MGREASQNCFGVYILYRPHIYFVSVLVPSNVFSRFGTRHIKDGRKEKRHGNSSLESSIHQTGDAAFTPATPQDLQHSRANTDSDNSQRATHGSKTKFNFLCAKGH
jgi:hypothetical protein